MTSHMGTTTPPRPDHITGDEWEQARKTAGGTNGRLLTALQKRWPEIGDLSQVSREQLRDSGC